MAKPKQICINCENYIPDKNGTSTFSRCACFTDQDVVSGEVENQFCKSVRYRYEQCPKYKEKAV